MDCNECLMSDVLSIEDYVQFCELNDVTRHFNT